MECWQVTFLIAVLYIFCLPNTLEGIVQKKADSKYQINKRSHDWLKVINYQ